MSRNGRLTGVLALFSGCLTLALLASNVLWYIHSFGLSDTNHYLETGMTMECETLNQTLLLLNSASCVKSMKRDEAVSLLEQFGEPLTSTGDPNTIHVGHLRLWFTEGGTLSHVERSGLQWCASDRSSSR